jgi:hypothetical protein
MHCNLIYLAVLAAFRVPQLYEPSIKFSDSAPQMRLVSIATSTVSCPQWWVQSRIEISPLIANAPSFAMQNVVSIAS